jgi:sugar fermentation stimulation protein A
MSEQKQTDSGCYQLILQVKKEQTLPVGKLGQLTFIPGVYVYCGRHLIALGNRINRHLKREKKTRWHIDYLTVNSHFNISGVIIFPDRVDECSLNQTFLQFNRAQIQHPDFGSSDCRFQCGAHLCYLEHFCENQLRKWMSNFRNVYLFQLE